ncbi:hypothetical protein M9Y10_032705 [Tritrichomonas musculus]|uniref:Ribosome control protein 1 domain-containing protein n=1 Tax=Tritrichomonas musculus TaxID=1915356 RepID=A0ABR2GYE8_9EUKA
MMSDYQMPLSEWPYGSPKIKQHHLSWSPAGFLASATGKIITILYPKKNKIEQILSFNPFNSPITSISWSCGPDFTGQTPLLLFASSESKNSAVFDISQLRTKASFQTSDSVILSSAWSQFSSEIFYTGDLNGKFCCYSIYETKLNLNWSLNAEFSIDFISFSPFTNSVVLASKTGTFKVVDTQKKGLEIYIGQFPVEDLVINDCRFYPFLNDTLIFVLPSCVFLYPLSDETLVPLVESDIQQECILNVAFDGSDETVFVVLHSQFAQEFVVKSSSFLKRGQINYLSSREQVSGTYLAQAMYKNKLAIMTKGLYVQLVECKNHRFVSTLVYSSICEKPLDYDIFSDYIVIGLDNGYISITEACAVTKFFYLLNGRVEKVKWLSDSTFIAIGRNMDGSQKAFFVDLTLMKITSLLKKNFEHINSGPIEINLSVNHIYYSLTMGRNLILVFQGQKQFATIFEEGIICVTFSDSKDNELWTVSTKWVGKKYTLLPNDIKEGYSISRMTTFKTTAFGHVRSEPDLIVSMNGFLLAALKTGDILIIDWYGSPARYLNLKFKQIIQFEVYYGRCIVRDSKHSIAIIDLQQTTKSDRRSIFPPAANLLLNDSNASSSESITEEFVITKSFEHMAKQFRMVNKSSALIHSPGKHSLTFVNLSDLSPIFVNSLLPVYSMSDFLKRIGQKVSIQEFVDVANNYGFGLLGTLFQALLPDPFSPLCPCANFSSARIRNFLSVINEVFSRLHPDILRIRKARLEMLLDNENNAKEILLETSKSSSSFPVDVMKAALIGSTDKNHILMSIISSLVNTGNDNDAIDILFFTRQFREAARILTSIGDIETVLEILATRLGDDNDTRHKIIDALVNALKSKKFLVQAAALLIADRRLEMAAEMLNEAGLECVAAIVKDAKIEGDSISFSFKQ